MAAPKVHEMPYTTRAEQPTTPTLSAYLMRLMVHKRSNLCVHVYRKISMAQTLKFIEEVGPSVIAFSLHSDLLPDLRSSTAQRIVDISRKHRFLILDDRSFMGDGLTAASQYVTGSPAPASWTDLTTAHILMGSGVIPALRDKAHKAITSASVSTIIEQNTDYPYLDPTDDLSLDTTGPGARTPGSGTESISPISPTGRGPPFLSSTARAPSDRSLGAVASGGGGWEDLRKGSVVSISTTISSTTEYIVSPTTDHPTSAKRPNTSATTQTLQSRRVKSKSDLDVAAEEYATASKSSGGGSQHGEEVQNEAEYPPVPLCRGLLLHAHIDASFTPEASSPAVTRSYARKCVEIAAAHRGYVIGLIVKTALPGAAEVATEVRQGLAPGVEEGDGWRDYLVWADVSPDDEEGGGNMSDGSQKAAERVIGMGEGGLGADVVCLGRGILDSRDRRAAVERVRKGAWSAYLSRIGLGPDEQL